MCLGFSLLPCVSFCVTCVDLKGHARWSGRWQHLARYPEAEVMLRVASRTGAPDCAGELRVFVLLPCFRLDLLLRVCVNGPVAAAVRLCRQLLEPSCACGGRALRGCTCMAVEERKSREFARQMLCASDGCRCMGR